jgi:hypothetical protein
VAACAEPHKMLRCAAIPTRAVEWARFCAENASFFSFGAGNISQTEVFSTTFLFPKEGKQNKCAYFGEN